MPEILTDIISKVVEVLWSKGPTGMLIVTTVAGWAAAAYIFVQNKVPKKAKKSEPDHIEYIKKVHEKHVQALGELNEKYNHAIMGLNEKRIEDLKSLASEYNELASNTLSTLDRLIEQLSSRKADQSPIDGDDNGSN